MIVEILVRFSVNPCNFHIDSTTASDNIVAHCELGDNFPTEGKEC